MRELAGQQVPAMTLLRYQRPDPENPHKYIEGATLQLAVDIDPLDESAKKSLLRKAQTAANNWESEYYRSFLAKLKESASTASPKQELWKALYQDYPSAHKNYPKSRVTPNLDDMVEGALSDSLDNWVVDGLEESIRLLQMRKPASISPLPMSTAQLTIYDSSGHAAKSTGPTRGAAPEYATDELTFTAELERNAVDTAEALLTSRTGIFMMLRREYEVLSAPLATKIVIDYDRAQQEYRRNANFLADAVLFATYQLPDSAEKNKKSISQQFERGILKAYSTDESPVPLASLETETLQALVARVNRAVLLDSWAPKQLNLRALSSAGSSRTLKAEDLDVPQVRSKTGTAQSSIGSKPAVEVLELASDAPARSGTEILLPGFRYRERKSTTTQGFLSLAGFDKSIHDQLVFDEKTPQWENAFFLLPGIGDDPELGVREVSTTVALHIKGTKWQEQTANWFIKKGWTLDDGEKPALWGILGFPLPEARAKFGEEELLESEFLISQEITCALGKNYKLNAEYRVKIFDGKSMIASPLECVQTIIFDFSNFRWRVPNMALYRAIVTVTQKLGRRAALTVQRNAVPGRELLSLPMLLDPMLDNGVGSVTAEIQFPAKYRDKENGPPESKILEWNQNKENLADLYPALFISIFNGDWQN